MKVLNSPIKFMIYVTLRAVRCPRTPILYYYCGKCKIRFPASSSECPKCGDKVGESPDPKQESPVPWWGSVLCMAIGIGAWVVSAVLKIRGHDEAARALIYVPHCALLGMSLKRD